MIEITCTKTEKKKIIDAPLRMDLPCLFPHTAKMCAVDYANYNCKKCLETKIKWNIK